MTGYSKFFGVAGALAFYSTTAMAAGVFGSEPNDDFNTAVEVDFSSGFDFGFGDISGNFDESDFFKFTNVGAGPLNATFTFGQNSCFGTCNIDMVFEVFDSGQNSLGTGMTNSTGIPGTDTLSLLGISPPGETLFASVRFGDNGGNSCCEGYSIALEIDPVNPVPLPASLPALAIGLGGLAALRRKQKRRPK